MNGRIKFSPNNFDQYKENLGIGEHLPKSNFQFLLRKTTFIRYNFYLELVENLELNNLEIVDKPKS